MRIIAIAFMFMLAVFPLPVFAAGQAESAAEKPAAAPSCESATDKTCMLAQMESLAGDIGEQNWRDQTYRETAKLLAREKRNDDAIALLEKIGNPDTKAMTIRGIGMAASKSGIGREERDRLFVLLRAQAEKIDHPPSYAIAMTYIAMAQAFAADDDGAMKTANDMENDALRNKAHGEAAEIQAAAGRFDSAMKSIAAIDSLAFRDKAYRTISKILADREKYEDSMKAAAAIENSYQKAQSVLYILARQITPEEVSLVE